MTHEEELSRSPPVLNFQLLIKASDSNVYNFLLVRNRESNRKTRRRIYETKQKKFKKAKLSDITQNEKRASIYLKDFRMDGLKTSVVKLHKAVSWMDLKSQTIYCG